MMFELRFTELEMKGLAGLIDAGVRSVGLRGVKDAAAILAKLEAAQMAATPPVPAVEGDAPA